MVLGQLHNDLYQTHDNQEGSSSDTGNHEDICLLAVLDRHLNWLDAVYHVLIHLLVLLQRADLHIQESVYHEEETDHEDNDVVENTSHVGIVL